jgi:hypothetical protein
MKKSVLISGMFVAAALVSQSALAEVKLRAGVGASSYKLGGDYTGAKSDYNSTNVGVTFAADNGFYVDLAGSSGSGKHDGWATANAPTTICGGTSCGNVASAEEDFKRSDYALIVGGSHLNQNNGIAVTFYGGLKGGTTTLGAKNAGLTWTEEKFETQGVVFGGGASFPIAQGRAGAVGVNLGLGIMSAKWTDNNGYNVKSNTAVGFSLGASYTYPITSNFGVVADYKLNAYSYAFGDTANPFTVNEAFSTLGGSIYVKF